MFILHRSGLQLPHNRMLTDPGHFEAPSTDFVCVSAENDIRKIYICSQDPARGHQMHIPRWRGIQGVDNEREEEMVDPDIRRDDEKRDLSTHGAVRAIHSR